MADSPNQPVPATDELLDAYDRILANVIDVHAQVAMDTADDKALHARAVEQFRTAQSQLRSARARSSSSGDAT